MRKNSRAMTILASLLVPSLAAVMLPTIAEADPVDNQGLANFFFDTSGDPFLTLSTKEVHSWAPSAFTAFVESDGEMIYDSHSMGHNATDLQFAGQDLLVQLDISDVVGYTDLSGADPYVDWEITARLRFSSAGGATISNCRTGYFTIFVTGDWGDTVSSTFSVPSLTGSGSGACNGNSSAINTHFGLGSANATFALYKFSAENDATGDPLEGSP